MNESPAISSTKSLPISVGLLNRRSITGGLVVLGIALIYILLVPFINGLIEGDNPFQVGQPYVIFDSYQITPQEGWEVEVSELFDTLSKSGAAMLFTGVVPADQPPDEAIQTTIDGLKGDANNTWVVGDPTTFVTDSGDHGVTVFGHTAENATQTWVISHGDSNVTVIATSPDGAWTSVSDEMEAMVESIVFLDQDTGQ